MILYLTLLLHKAASPDRPWVGWSLTQVQNADYELNIGHSDIGNNSDLTVFCSPTSWKGAIGYSWLDGLLRNP
jgi:hypothetical protein